MRDEWFGEQCCLWEAGERPVETTVVHVENVVPLWACMCATDIHFRMLDLEMVTDNQVEPRDDLFWHMDRIREGYKDEAARLLS